MNQERAKQFALCVCLEHTKQELVYRQVRIAKIVLLEVTSQVKASHHALFVLQGNIKLVQAGSPQ